MAPRNSEVGAPRSAEWAESAESGKVAKHAVQLPERPRREDVGQTLVQLALVDPLAPIGAPEKAADRCRERSEVGS